MVLLRRYRERLAGQHAVDYLRHHGIPAALVGDHTQSAFGGGIFDRLGFTGFDVVILHRQNREAAERLLAELDASPPELDEDWEDSVRPDLSQLAPGTPPPPCPRCDAPLPLDAELSACPSCGEPVDVVERLVQLHGPEVLDGCCVLDEGPAMAATVAEEVDVRALALPCPSCRYSLAGLDERGRCPECGGLYDKLDMLHGYG